MKQSILIVEDDAAIRRGLEIALQNRDYDVATASSAEEAQAKVRTHDPDLIILDVMLPGRSGLEFCIQLRASGDSRPILMLTARSEESDRVLGLDLGADDYVTKPFSLRELEARVRALLRRTVPEEETPTQLVLGPARIDFKDYRAWLGDEELRLPPKAYGLLKELASRRGEVVTREELLERVWGYDDAMPTTRTVDTHVAQIRAALEADPAEPAYIRTVHGVGYSLAREA